MWRLLDTGNKGLVTIHKLDNPCCIQVVYKGIVALRQNFEGPAYTLIHGLNVHHALKILEKF